MSELCLSALCDEPFEDLRVGRLRQVMVESGLLRPPLVLVLTPSRERHEQRRKCDPGKGRMAVTWETKREQNARDQS